MDEPDRPDAGDRTRLGAAVGTVREAVSPVERTETVPPSSSVGRVLAERVTATRPVPHYDAASVDGYAVVATETADGGDCSPAVFELGDRAGRGRVVRVDDGDELPPGADAVLGLDDVTRGGRDTSGDSDRETVVATATVRPGENVIRTGEWVSEGATVYASGRRLRRSDPAHLRSVGVGTVEVTVRPTVAVIPVGAQLVAADPGAGEIVETDGLTVAGFLERWGGAPTYRNVVSEGRQSLRVAVTRDLTRDLVVTIGATGAGERDRLPEVVADLGEVAVDGVAIEPGGTTGFGVVHGVPVVMLPGSPRACLVAAMELLRPAIKRTADLPVEPYPVTVARLDERIDSEQGVRTVAPVDLDRPEPTRDSGRPGIDVDPDDPAGNDADERPVATPTRTGLDPFSTAPAVAGWVVVPEGRRAIPAGETVAVQHREYQP